ncbi:DNA-binding transcriptional MerR regulator [Amycolatopsis bartoniae]|uniref:MerR family transcriptional regulator n=1 Tax=Amycolatopsis bartoniae TaxID=941986 RepID=UPI00184296D4|nr:MerR family transcriptional regulator [Amycolatopsis bartoniae]MBB2936684.1 DNA-binding transcriptional MerR regulator [Amycolatopsis bartoniae]
MAKLRITDLARMAGVSVQQVRNYVELGVLPPVERTASGYRVFTEVHAEALLIVRQLAEGHGWERTRTIMRAVHAGDLGTVLATVDASHGELDRERSDIARVLGAFDEIGREPAGARPRRPLRIGEVADVVGVRTPVLRLWEQRGLLSPEREPGTGYRVYGQAELRKAEVVALLRRGNYPFAVVRSVLDELGPHGRPERVRAELAKREQDLHRRSLKRLRASAALSAYLTQ